jgi:hypothetical protein
MATEDFEMTAASILWRRLDVPGHDACSLEAGAAGWRLRGTAVFRHEDVPACLAYQAECDSAWRSQRGRVEGWLGGATFQVEIARASSGLWTFNGVATPDTEDCADLDFGFTPATNLFQLRRLALREGQAEDAPSAWLDVSSSKGERLSQRYERRGAGTYFYQAARFQYAALLEVGPSGFVHRYPDLWEAEI